MNKLFLGLSIALVTLSTNGMHLMRRSVRPLSTVMRKNVAASAHLSKRAIKPMLMASVASTTLMCAGHTVAAAQHDQQNTEPVTENNAVLKFSEEDIKNLIEHNSKPIILKFSATWCKPCKDMAPLFEEFAKNNNDYICCEVNFDKAQSLADTYGVENLPTLLVISRGTVKGKLVGSGYKNYESFAEGLEKAILFDLTQLSQEERNKKLFEAIQTGSPTDVAACIKAKSNVNATLDMGPFSMTPILFVPLVVESPEICKNIITQLVDAGANTKTTFQPAPNESIDIIGSCKQRIEIYQQNIVTFEQLIAHINAHQAKK